MVDIPISELPTPIEAAAPQPFLYVVHVCAGTGLGCYAIMDAIQQRYSLPLHQIVKRWIIFETDKNMISLHKHLHAKATVPIYYCGDLSHVDS